uniref:Uncharacterized protein n=1 Tax=Schistocephalus solidus TaxID=70667 RepID=A0A0X3PZ13_SCHSO
MLHIALNKAKMGEKCAHWAYLSSAYFAALAVLLEYFSLPYSTVLYRRLFFILYLLRSILGKINCSQILTYNSDHNNSRPRICMFSHVNREVVPLPVNSFDVNSAGRGL